MNGTDERVVFAGGPREAGEAFGRAAGARIRDAVESGWEEYTAGGFPPEEMEEAARGFERTVERYSPWWIEEFHACAAAAEVPAGKFIALQAMRGALRAGNGECTSFAVSVPGGMILHKNRDHACLPQLLFLRHVEGTYRYLGSIEAGNAGTAFFCNEAGLCGVSNTGSPARDLRPPGLPEHFLMRLLAERASTCREALGLVAAVVEDGYCASWRTGTIFLLADGREGVVVETAGRHMGYERLDRAAVRTNLFLLPEMKNLESDVPREWRMSSEERLDRARALLAAGEPGPAAAFAFSRDAAGTYPVCGERTVSAGTFFLPEQGGSRPLAWFCLGDPRFSCYIPLHPALEGLPPFLVDGSMWETARRLRDLARSPLPAVGIETSEPLFLDEDIMEAAYRVCAYLEERAAGD